MAFDETKDVVVDSVTVVENSNTRIMVQLCQYNGGAIKVGIKRENYSKGEWGFAKLGRMTAAEFIEVVPAGLELVNKYDLH